MRRCDRNLDAQEQSHAPGELLASHAGLVVAVGPRKQNTRPAPLGANHDSPLGTAIIGQRRRVFRQLEVQDLYEKATTIDIPDRLYRRIKARAAHEGRTARTLILLAVEQSLATTPASRGHRVTLPIVPSKKPGVHRARLVR